MRNLLSPYSSVKSLLLSDLEIPYVWNWNLTIIVSYQFSTLSLQMSHLCGRTAEHNASRECCDKGLLQLISQGWKWAPWDKALKALEQWKMFRHYLSIRMASHFGFLNEKNMKPCLSVSHWCSQFLVLFGATTSINQKINKFLFSVRWANGCHIHADFEDFPHAISVIHISTRSWLLAGWSSSLASSITAPTLAGQRTVLYWTTHT